jgi:hypothetical protein
MTTILNDDYMLRRNELAREIVAEIWKYALSKHWDQTRPLAMLDIEKIVADRLNGEVIRFFVLAPSVEPTLKNAWLETASPTRRGCADRCCTLWSREVWLQLTKTMSIVECIASVQAVTPFTPDAP